MKHQIGCCELINNMLIDMVMLVLMIVIMYWYCLLLLLCFIIQLHCYHWFFKQKNTMESTLEIPLEYIYIYIIDVIIIHLMIMIIQWIIRIESQWPSKYHNDEIVDSIVIIQSWWFQSISVWLCHNIFIDHSITSSSMASSQQHHGISGICLKSGHARFGREKWQLFLGRQLIHQVVMTWWEHDGKMMGGYGKMMKIPTGWNDCMSVSHHFLLPKPHGKS